MVEVGVAAQVIATVDDDDVAAAGGGLFGDRQAEEPGADDHEIDVHRPGSVRDAGRRAVLGRATGAGHGGCPAEYSNR